MTTALSDQGRTRIPGKLKGLITCRLVGIIESETAGQLSRGRSIGRNRGQTDMLGRDILRFQPNDP